MSWTTGDPSNKNRAVLPPLDDWFNDGAITEESFGIINGGTKPHNSLPVSASTACSIPLLAAP